MFTGIIEEIGRIDSFVETKSGKQCCIFAKKVVKDLHVGDSMAVNGVCLTVINNKNNIFTLDIVNETLEKSNLGDLLEGEYVNLERAMKASGRFDGHILQGHVETVGVVLDKQQGKEDTILWVGLDPEWMRYCIPKGSIALDGISLTIAKIDANVIEIALIPHTLKNTTLALKAKSDTINIETDIIGRYIDRLISFDDQSLDIDGKILKAIRHIQYGES